MIFFIIFINYLLFAPKSIWIAIGLVTLLSLYGSIFLVIRKSSKIHPTKKIPRTIRKQEILYTFISFVIFFSIVHFYFRAFEYGILHFDFTLSIWTILWGCGFVILHDAYFYGAHRVLHYPHLMRYIHRIHHLSQPSSLWSSYSFHPIEAIMYAGVTGIIWIFDISWFALLFAVIYNDFFTLLGHSGYERFEKKDHKNLTMTDHATTTYHDNHHIFPYGNYGLYFTYLDHLFRTRVQTKQYSPIDTPYKKSKIVSEIWDNLQDDHKIIIQTTKGATIRTKEYRDTLLSIAHAHQKNIPDTQNTVAIFITDQVLFSQIVIASLMCGDRVVLLEPSMGYTMILSKIASANVTHIYIDGWLYDALCVRRSALLKSSSIFFVHGWTIFGLKHTKIHPKQKNSPQSHIEWTTQDEGSDAMMIFTGGTTNEPKGVVHSLSSLYHTLDTLKQFVSNTKIFYADLPHFLLLGLLTGVRVVSGPSRISSRRLMKMIDRFQIDTYFSPPYRYQYCIDHHLSLPKSLKQIILGSAPIYTSFLKKLLPLTGPDQHIRCIYGMTEILPIASIDAREKVTKKSSGDILGYPIGGITYDIRTDGELWVQGNHQMSHYLHSSPQTYIQTGDIVTEGGGLLVMQGRKKDMIIRKDYNIYPSIYEDSISAIPGIHDSALVGVYKEDVNDEIIYLFIDSDGRYSAAKLLTLLKSGKYSIDTYALPDEILFMKLPRCGRQNKIDKNMLRAVAKKHLGEK